MELRAVRARLHASAQIADFPKIDDCCASPTFAAPAAPRRGTGRPVSARRRRGTDVGSWNGTDKTPDSTAGVHAGERLP